jgi:hypothetical protein
MLTTLQQTGEPDLTTSSSFMRPTTCARRGCVVQCWSSAFPEDRNFSVHPACQQSMQLSSSCSSQTSSRTTPRAVGRSCSGMRLLRLTSHTRSVRLRSHEATHPGRRISKRTISRPSACDLLCIQPSSESESHPIACECHHI